MGANEIPHYLQNVILQGDCLEVMKDIPDGSVDAVICDLPYGVLNGESEGGSWDTIIPFEPLWAEYRRVCKPTAAIVLFAQGMFTADLMHSNPKMWRYNLIWDKTVKVGFLNANRMPLRRHEDICVFYEKLPTYNPQMIAGEVHRRNCGTGRKEKATNRCYGDYKTTPSTMSGEFYPSSIIDISKGNNEEIFMHPTQKPVDLLRYLVLTYTNEGDTVLDNCCGSGTLAIAAIEEKRKFICIEKDPKYFEIAKKRINDRLREPTLF